MLLYRSRRLTVWWSQTTKDEFFESLLCGMRGPLHELNSPRKEWGNIILQNYRQRTGRTVAKNSWTCLIPRKA